MDHDRVSRLGKPRRAADRLERVLLGPVGAGQTRSVRRGVPLALLHRPFVFHVQLVEKLELSTSGCHQRSQHERLAGCLLELESFGAAERILQR